MTTFPRVARFYPVVPTAAWVSRVVEAGARFVQLRQKSDDRAALRAEVEAALLACQAAGADLVVNDHWDLAIDAGAPWVHLGQEDLDSADLGAVRRRDIKIGVSTHDHTELARALSVDPDYVALGPIYPTTLKVMPWAPQGLTRIGEWKQLVGRRPLVAIGGISLDRGAGCFAAGADSVAVVSDVVGSADPEARVAAWLEEGRRSSAT